MVPPSCNIRYLYTTRRIAKRETNSCGDLRFKSSVIREALERMLQWRYNFSSETVSGWRVSLNQNRLKQDIFFPDSRCVRRPWDFTSASSFDFLFIISFGRGLELQNRGTPQTPSGALLSWHASILAKTWHGTRVARHVRFK